MIFPWYVIAALVATGAVLLILLIIEIIQLFTKKDAQEKERKRGWRRP